MQSLQPRDISPRPYNRENEDVTEDGLTEHERETGFYPPVYGSSEHLIHGHLPQGYVGEPYYDRGNEILTHADSGAPYEPINDPIHAAQYNYMNTSMSTTQPLVPSQASQFPMPSSRGTHDITGQSCPPGGRPRVSTTIWEDEGTLCFQVEAKQVTVARREGMFPASIGDSRT